MAFRLINSKNQIKGLHEVKYNRASGRSFLGKQLIMPPPEVNGFLKQAIAKSDHDIIG
jgi:hypothetical protein